jgi:hypothetical protein
MPPVEPAARIARSDPYGARERSATPVARSPHPARADRIVVAGNPRITRAGSNRRSIVNRRRRRRRINWHANSDSNRKMGRKSRASREQQQRQKFEFHICFLPPAQVTSKARAIAEVIVSARVMLPQVRFFWWNSTTSRWIPAYRLGRYKISSLRPTLTL